MVKLVPPPDGQLFPTVSEHVRMALSPGQRVTRYHREWVVGGTDNIHGVLVGRLGFVGEEGVAEIWDEKTKDFTEMAVPAGMTAPWAVDLNTLTMAVQPRGNIIRLNGLLGAIRSLLSQNQPGWDIETISHKTNFEKWRETVERVTQVRMTVRKPNPHYRDTPNIESLLEQADAEYARLELNAEDGIDTDSSFIQESQNHIEQGAYGEARFVGVRGNDISVYNTALGSEEQPLSMPVKESGEVDQGSLARILDDQGTQEDTGVHGDTDSSQE